VVALPYKVDVRSDWLSIATLGLSDLAHVTCEIKHKLLTAALELQNGRSAGFQTLKAGSSDWYFFQWPIGLFCLQFAGRAQRRSSM